MKYLKLLALIFFLLTSPLAYSQSPLTDAGISSIQSPYGTYCSGALPIKAILTNYGYHELDSVTIGWSVNGKVQKTYSWYGKITKDSGTLITIGTYLFPKGKYVIKAWTSMPNGLVDSITDNDTTLIHSIIGPNAGGRDTICYGSNITLGTSFISGDTYSWTSNPVGFTSTERHPTLTPKVSTTYYLTETNTATNCTQKDTAVIVIYSTHPVADFSINLDHQCLKGNNVVVTDKSVVLGSIKGDTITSEKIVSRVWDFGDKTTSTQQNPSHTYILAGTYIVTLTVTGKQGCTHTISKKVVIYPTPLPSIKGFSAICKGMTTSYVTTKDSGSTYSWDIKGGTITTGKGSDSIRIYWPGTVGATVDLVVTNMYGCDNAAKEIAINVLDPTIAPLQSACLGEPYHFFEQSKNAASYLWTFGNGDSSTVSSPIYTYKALGTYTVTMRGTSGSGCRDSVTGHIIVHALPDAHWKVGSLSVPYIQFKAKDTTLGSANYDWEFGDATRDNGYNPSHIFPSNKTYQVRLLVTDANGCINEADSTVRVKASGIFEASPENINMTVFPNPFKNVISIELTPIKKGCYSISMTDMAGKEVKKIIIEKETSGNHEVDLNVAFLHPGIYILKMITDDGIIARTLVKY